MRKVMKLGSLVAIALLLSAAPSVLAQNSNPKAKSECCQQKKECKKEDMSKKCDCKKECKKDNNGKSECAKNKCEGKCAAKPAAKK